MLFKAIVNNYKSLIYQFKWRSIFITNLKRFMLLITIPLIILNFFTSLYQHRATMLELRMASQQTFSATENTVADIYAEVENLFYLLVLEYGLDIFMQTTDISSLTPDNIKYVLKPLETAKTYCNISHNINAVDIYSYSADYVLSTSRSGKSDIYADKAWMNTSSDELCFSLSNGSSFCICYNLVSNMEKRGLIVFNIDPTRIKEALNVTSDDTYTLSLYNTDKQLIYSSDKETIAEPDFGATPGSPSTVQSSKYTTTTFATDNVYLHLRAEYAKPVYSSFIFSISIFTIAVLILSFVLAFILSLYSYQTIRDIIMQINDMEITDMRIADESDASMNEIMYINQNIVSMKNKNKELEQELVAKFAELRKMHTQILQMQLTPHFLFNALNTINLSLMLKNGIDNPESDSILILSDLLSSSIDVKRYMVTVDQELMYCNKYIEIQSLMSDHNFDFSIDADETVKNCMAVKFSLQPLVENAFKHGIKLLKNKSRGMLDISIRKEDNCIKYRITNNGPVPDAETLQRINTTLETSIETDGSHVGLFNTNRRIKLIFGEEYGLSIGVENNLTTVTVTTPAIADFNTNKDKTAD